KHGKDIAILSLGSRLHDALEAATLLEKQGYSVTVADARFAKPIDAELIESLASAHRLLLTVEEGSIGGFGSHVVQYLSQAGLLERENFAFRSLFLPDYFIEHNSPKAQLSEAGLDADGIVKAVLGALRANGNKALSAKARHTQ
ncbi:MAG: 1-deoxy-D-xylulose-5-phosphate synthase, partial [Proteobacteria bacterium]|nr:1-deoxy-D-xylulose-5-phosphate synthase [Pseudomonadota bacterium]